MSTLKRVDVEVKCGGVDNLSRSKNLHLDKRDIENIDENVFQGLDNLENLDLGGNKLQKINISTFKGLGNLKKLWLDENQVVKIEENAFVHLTQLQVLSFSNNKLSRIEANMFHGLHNLVGLILSGNLITDIDLNAFLGLTNLRLLMLNDNPQLNRFNRKCFEPLTSIGVIVLSNSKSAEKTYASYFNKSAISSYWTENCIENWRRRLNGNYLTSWSQFLGQFPERSEFSSPFNLFIHLKILI